MERGVRVTIGRYFSLVLGVLLALACLVDVSSGVSASASPKVSVVVPIFNVARYLPRCLDSLIGQTLPDLEFICVDDGSTDDSPKILQEYAHKDNRFKIITKPNQGCWAARNAGLEIATGEYVAFVDSDDYLELDAYETAYKAAHAHDVDILYFGFYRNETPIKYNNQVINVEKNTDFRKLPQHEFVWNRLYKNSMLRESGVKFTDVPIIDDFCFDYMVLPWAKKLESIENVFYHYNLQNTGSITHTTKNKERTLKIIPLVCQAWRKKNYLQGNELFLFSVFLYVTNSFVSPFFKQNDGMYKTRAKEILDSFGSDIYNEKNVAKLSGQSLKILRKLEEFARNEEKFKVKPKCA